MTQNPDYLSVLLAGTQAASQRDAWKARCEALQAELVTQEVRHREEVAGLEADLEAMSAQRQHWVRVAQDEMARRAEVKEDTAKERDRLRATATAWVRVSRRGYEGLREALSERDKYSALAAAWETAARDLLLVAADCRQRLQLRAYIPASFQAAADLSEAARQGRSSEQGENAADAEKPTGDGNAPWIPCPEYLELGRVSYGVYCVRYFEGYKRIPNWAQWSACNHRYHEGWAYVAYCHSASPNHAREHAQALRQEYADNDVFRHAVQ